MANWKKIGAGAGAIAAVAAIGAGTLAYETLETSRSDVADDNVTLATFEAVPEAAERGEYVMRMGDCAACHTRGQGEMAGGYEIETPFGKLVSSNITPDTETGIGNMTERDFFNALRQGIGQHGLLYPAMPYTAYAKLTDADMHDLWAYMSTVEPVQNDIDENAGMPFPFNIRLAMAGWDMLFFKNEGFDGDPVADRGRYIVDGAGHCSACHSPRNILGAEQGGAYLHGANVDGWHAPDITSNAAMGVGGTSAEDLARYLGTGTDGVAVASGPMAEAVQHSLQYLTVDDRLAMANYLLSVEDSGAERTAPAKMADAAELAYEVNCSACHGLNGEGIVNAVPAFKGNNALLADPSSLIHVMLSGARAPYTEGARTAAGMPSFAWKMDDAQIASVLDYVRNSWGNQAEAIAPAKVGQMRETLGASQPISALPE